MNIKLNRFIAIALTLWLLFCCYGIMSAQIPHDFTDCNCDVTTFERQPRIYTPGPCGIDVEGGYFTPTQVSRVLTYQVISKQNFLERGPKDSQVNYLQIYNAKTGLYVTYVHPDMFWYYRPDEIQKMITRDGVCDWKDVVLTFNRFPGAYELINNRLQ